MLGTLLSPLHVQIGFVSMGSLVVCCAAPTLVARPPLEVAMVSCLGRAEKGVGC